MDISIVIPLLNEEESLPELAAWIDRVMIANNLSYEIIMINDGSTDKSWSVIEQLSKKNPCIKGISFRRNYGKSAALFCGFKAAEGDVVITMDADLQDSPDEIPELYNMVAKQGFDLVSGWKRKRYDPITKTIPSKLYNATARKMTGVKLHDLNCGLKAYKKQVIKSIEVYGEMHRYIPVLAKQAGFGNIAEKEVAHQARKYGVSKFGLSRFINGYLDLLTVIFLSKFGKKPMHFFGLLGTLMFIVSFFCLIGIGIYKLIYLSSGRPAILIANNPYFYIALTVMIIGVQLFLAGFIGELVSRSSSDRNDYLIDKTV